MKQLFPAGFGYIVAAAKQISAEHMNTVKGKRPLDGIRVLEVGQLLAGPFAGNILAYYGAEVIKVETPGSGDPLRKWRQLGEDGTSHWWRSLGRNKKCITANLRTDEGRKLVRKLARRCDVLIENFRPGTMEKWGLGPDDFSESNPGLIYSRISGYGQDGPYASKPGFASVCEGLGGLRYINGLPGERPMRLNLSIGDSLAGLHCALGIVMACLHRSRDPEGRGQVVDTALYEAVFNMMEGVIPEYSGSGAIREPSGSTITGIVPTNTYKCSDEKFVIIGANGDSIFKRLCLAMGRPDMAEDERMADNAGRVVHEAEIDEAISAWMETMDSETALERLEAARVPAGPIYNVADMMADEHFQARGLFEAVDVHGRELKIPAMVPRLSETPGRTEWAGGEVGEYNDEIYGDMLGMAAEEIAALKEQGVI
jgi:crotonobetainyl-CoA:carnitine CoA-transferase CaiB-like acyl-CoA transferase